MTKMLTKKDFAEIRRWMYRNARPLDIMRWRFYFEGGKQEDILTALAAYQNEDGGFGHALEADCWNPGSSPIQTADATDLLREIGFTEKEHPIIQGILRYLASGNHCENGYWMNTVPENNDFPHAPWWTYQSGSSCDTSYNPTGVLLGFLLQYADRDTALYQKGMETAKTLVRSCEADAPNDFHSLNCCFCLFDGLRRAGLWEELGAEGAFQVAVKKAGDSIEKDTANWGGYVCLPSVFIQNPESPVYPGNEALMAEELDRTIQGRRPKDVWGITWQWGAYPEAFSVSETWWKGRHAINTLLLLDAFGRLEKD